MVLLLVAAGAAAGGVVTAGAAATPGSVTTGTSTAGAGTTTPTSVGQAQQQLSTAQQRSDQLAGTVASSSRQVGDLGTSITALEGQVATLQSNLYRRRSELLRVRDQLGAAETRLGGLEKVKRTAERVLAQQLVGAYEGGQPDIITVVVEANGFPDLLEQLNFAQRIGRQDARIVARVRSARRAVAAEARTLGRLTARAQNVAESVLAERNRVARYRLRLVARQLAAAKAKAAATGQLASAQQQVSQLTQQLDQLQASQPATPRARRPTHSASAPATSIPFPVTTGEAAPPATWSVGDGVAIAAPAGTQELALCSGTVVLHGIGGMGASAPVLRCNQAIDGHTYVFYGFVSPAHLAAIGTNVTRGQPIARVADGAVGTATGPHLDIGFADSSGAPLGAAAREMLVLLKDAYAS